MKALVIIIVVTLSSFSVIAQELPTEFLERIENYLESDESVDLFLLQDRLEAAYSSPIDINSDGDEELSSLQLLSTLQIAAISHHRAQFGNLIMIEELQAIPELSIQDIRRISPFVKVSDPSKLPISIPLMFRNAQQQVFLKWSTVLEDKRGFESRVSEPPNYIGDKNSLFLRYRGNYANKLSYGFIMEKDQGEQYLDRSITQGLDYITAHVYLKDYNALFREIAIGDYSVSMGQGLITHNGFGAGKSAWVTAIKKDGRALRPYNSVNENAYQRGVGVTLCPLKELTVTVFGSQVNRDANVVIDSLNDQEETYFTSFQATGNHRTSAELEDRGQLNHKSYGGSLTYSLRHIKIGMNHMANSFGNELVRSDDTYNLYRFGGDKLANSSVDYSLSMRNLSLFGESAYSSTKGWAHVGGLLLGLDRRLSMAVVLRDYDKKYNAFMPNAFGESSLVNDEAGVYLGMELKLTNQWTLRTYYDMWRNEWLRARVNNPGFGKEFLLRLDHIIKRKYHFYIQLRIENKYRNIPPEDLPALASEQVRLNVALPSERANLRIQFNNKISKHLELRNRIAFSRATSGAQHHVGFLILQDVLYKPVGKPYSFTGRVALFDIEDFDSRIYTYENSLLYEFSIPFFDGQGLRYYLNLRIKPLRFLTAEFRIAQTYKTIGQHGSGNEFIDGKTRTDVRAQLRFSF